MLRSTIASVFTVFPATHLLCPPARTFAQLHLAARAEVGGAPADDDADDRTAAGGAGLPLAGVDEELVLHRPLLAATVAVVVDRGAAVVDPGLEGGDDRVAQRLQVLGLHRPGR